MLKRLLILSAFAALLQSCGTVHIHNPFSSGESKAKQHLLWASEHDSTLLDSTSRIITIEGKTARFDLNVDMPNICRSYLTNLEPFLDTSTGIKVKFIQGNDSIIYVEAECPPVEVPCDCPETVKVVDGNSNWSVFWFSVVAFFIGFFLGAWFIFRMK